MGEPVILTSENADAFYVRKLGLVVEPPVAPSGEPGAESQTTQTAEKAPEEAQATTSEPTQTSEGSKEDKQRLHLRFSEHAEARKAAETARDKAIADANSAHEARQAAERRAQEAEAKLNPPKADELGPEPQETQFTTAKEYAQAWADWNQDKGEREKAQKREVEERQKVVNDFTDRRQKFAAQTPDFEQAIAGSAGAVHNAVRDAILESEYGPQIMYHLAKNPVLFDELKKLPLASQVRRIGRLEATFDKGGAVQQVASAEVSRAPAPITPLKGANSSPESPIDSEGEFHGTYAEWKEARQARRIK